MIPENITRGNVIQAIEEIDERGVPKRRLSKKYYLKYGDKTYPPKYVVSIACRYATGRELPSDDFSGGEGETNKFLRSLGFEVVPKQKASKK